MHCARSHVRWPASSLLAPRRLREVHGCHARDEWLVERHDRQVFGVTLIRAEPIDRREFHDQHDVPAAGILQFVATDLDVLEVSDGAAQGAHALAEGGDVAVAGVLAVLEEDVVPQHASVPDHPGTGHNDRTRAVQRPSRGLVPAHEDVTFGRRHTDLMQAQRDTQSSNTAPGNEYRSTIHGPLRIPAAPVAAPRTRLTTAAALSRAPDSTSIRPSPASMTHGLPRGRIAPHLMDLQSFDLNLLVALDALLSERSVTNAGRRIHLSQSAMSGVLARLRRAFN